jgi:secretion/DNA translocation related TadE-like protein
VSRPGGGARDAQGAATPVVLATLAVIVAVALTVVAAGSMVLAQAKTSSAADLAALAAARIDRDARAQGRTPSAALADACDEARAIASLNGAVVTQCERATGLSVRVTVTTRVDVWPEPVAASARAGPSWG